MPRVQPGANAVWRSHTSAEPCAEPTPSLSLPSDPVCFCCAGALGRTLDLRCGGFRGALHLLLRLPRGERVGRGAHAARTLLASGTPDLLYLQHCQTQGL